MFTWLFGSPTSPPRFLHMRSSRLFITLTVSSAVFTDIFAYGIVVPVFPFALTQRANIAPEDVQRWISIFLAVYGAALLISSPIFGWVADRNESRQIPFLAGLVALGASTALLCVGSSVAIFAAGRVLQGISAAVVWCTGLALLVDVVGADEGIGVAMGYVGLAMSLAVLLAPLLGGVVFQMAGYYAVYAMVFGLIFVDVVLRLAMIEPRNARRWLGEDEGVGVVDVVDVDVVEDGGQEKKANHQDGDAITKDDMINKESTAEAHTNTSNTPIPSATATPTEESSALRHTPLQKFISSLPPVISLFASRRILAALWACTMQASLLTSFDSILPLFVHDTFNWTSTGAGLIFLPLVAASFLGPYIGKLSDKYGPRWLATGGFLLACPFLILLRLITNNSLTHKILLCVFLTLIGAGLTLAIIPIMAEIAYAVESKSQKSPPGFFGRNGAYAQAYGLFNMAWAAGSMIGPLLAGLVREAEGWGTATLILGCVSFFTALLTVGWTGGSIF